MHESPPQTPQDLDNNPPLPPVEPPSASFIVQLFLIPGVIVIVIVSVWAMFHWLAQMGNDPASYVEAIKQKRRHDTRWHAAVNLTSALRENDALKHDADLAKQLAQVLDDEVESGEMGEESLALRIFLCKALGEFYVAEAVLPALLKAAAAERDEAEIPVRVAALEALAVLASNVPTIKQQAPANEQLTQTLIDASRADHRLVRSTAAFALGVVGNEAALKRLNVLLNDSAVDVRYNAATGLARHGKAEVVPTLAEMLSPNQTHALEVEAEKARPFKRTMIHVNALRATGQLAVANPAADLSRLRSAIETLLQAEDVGDDVRKEAPAVLAKLAR